MACTRTCWKHDICCVFFFSAQPGGNRMAWVNVSGCTRGSLEAGWWTCVKCLCHIKEGETVLAFTCRPSSSLLLPLHLFPVEVNTGMTTTTSIHIGLFFPTHNKSQMMKICGVFCWACYYLLRFLLFFFCCCFFKWVGERVSDVRVQSANGQKGHLCFSLPLCVQPSLGSQVCPCQAVGSSVF